MSFTLELMDFNEGHGTMTYHYHINKETVLVDFTAGEKVRGFFRPLQQDFPRTLDDLYGQGVEQRIEEIHQQFNMLYVKNILPPYRAAIAESVNQIKAWQTTL